MSARLLLGEGAGRSPRPDKEMQPGISLEGEKRRLAARQPYTPPPYAASAEASCRLVGSEHVGIARDERVVGVPQAALVDDAAGPVVVVG